MEIVRMKTESDETAWAAYVESSPRSSFSHQLTWKRILDKAYGFDSHYLMAVEGKEVRGVLPLFLGNSLFFGSFLATALYCSHGGVCADNPDAERLLVERAIQLTRETGAGYLEIKNDGTKCEGLTTKDQYCTMVLELDPDPKKVWEEKVHASRRKYIRRALKMDLTFEIGGAELFEDYFRVMSRSLRNLGTPIHSRRFYRTVFTEFDEKSRIIVVKKDGEAVSAGNFFLFKDTVYAMWGGSNREYQKMYPNELMYWKGIEFACTGGYRYLDFGRSQWNSGTYEFKSRMGAEPKPLFYQYYLNKVKELPDIDPTNPRYRFSISIWKKLPLFLVNALGSKIIRYVP